MLFACLLLAAVHINKVTAKRRPRRYRCVDGRFLKANPSCKKGMEDEHVGSGFRTHAPPPSPPLGRPAPRAVSRAPTAVRATRLNRTRTWHPSTRPDVVQWPSGNDAVICFECDVTECNLWTLHNCVECTMRLFATLWMVWTAASSINVSLCFDTCWLCGNGKFVRTAVSRGFIRV